MHARFIFPLSIVVAALFAVAPAAAQQAKDAKAGYVLGERLPQPRQAAPAAGYKEIPWEALVPKDWDPAAIFKGIDLSKMEDGDPRAMEALEKMREAWDHAPAERSMNGARVRIPGFIVPLETIKGQVTEFLLVPYFGACIHSPPPPANQTIHVFPAKPVKNAMMDAVWINGTLEISSSKTVFGNAGYRMKADLVTPYKK